MANEEPSIDPRERVADVVRSHEHARAIASFVFDVLSRQAEGRALFAGREYVEKRAAEAELPREHAETPLGNVLAILERGPETELERELLAAFAVAGFGALEAPSEGDRDGFVRHADWFEIATPLSLYPFVDPLLERELAAEVWKRVGERCRSASDERPSQRRALDAARLTALASSTSSSARSALDAVARDALDPATGALAVALGGRKPLAEDAREPTVRGRYRHAPSGAGRVVRWLSGFAAITWAARGLLALVGGKNEVELALAPNGLRLRGKLTLLGRTIREREEIISTAAVQTLTRDRSYPWLHTLAGIASFTLGVLAGGFFVIDGARSGETILLLAGALVVLVGVAFDLALDVLVPARRGRVALELALHPKRRIRIDRVVAGDADAFVRALEERVR
jgi:hypothetical protein